MGPLDDAMRDARFSRILRPETLRVQPENKKFEKK
jgi:hypothetical protein